MSRFVCDLNRDPDDVSAGAVPEHPAPRNSDGRGFIWAITTTGVPTLARPLALGEWRERTAIHAAYHDAITRALERARDRFGYAILLDGHSMPSRGRPGHKDPGRAARRGRTRRSRRHQLRPGADGARDAPLRGRGPAPSPPNDPYKGGFITTHHGRPAERIHAIQIELRRDLYMDEDAYEPMEPGFAKLRGIIDGLVASLRTFRL